jgi:cytochrome P450
VNPRHTEADFPRDPIAAVTHRDPYPYYARLVAEKPFYRDEALGLWVASSAEAVTAVLSSDLCRVRPPAEPVPKALLGSPAAAIFRHLVRMNDGMGHSPFKQALSATLDSVDGTRVAEQSKTSARTLANELEPMTDARRLADFACRLPVYVVASLLGIPAEGRGQVARWIDDFVRCLSPLSTPTQIEQSKTAAGQLLDLFRSLLAGGRTEGLLAALIREAPRLGRADTDVIVANGIGFLSQSYEATAGLIGNTLLALISRPSLREQIVGDPSLLRHVVQEVLRYDPPIQNTRRFLAGSGTILGQQMKEGDAILVVLAAANRDPLANPDPERFETLRENRRVFTFGAGAHGCPGESLASSIAEAGVRQLMSSGLRLEEVAGPPEYRPSLNARIPLWETRAHA